MLPDILLGIAWVATCICTFFLVQACLLWCYSLFHTKPEPTATIPSHIPYSIVIPAYEKNLRFCPYLLNSIEKAEFSPHQVLIVADNCSSENFPDPSEGVQLIIPERRIGSKIHSIRYALNYLSHASAGVVILDPDNLVHPAFFKELMPWINSGFKAVQGIRIAKNTETQIARADSLGEYYYNYADRYVPFRCGSSATISGSGFYIASGLLADFFDSRLFNKAEQGIILGEDKLLQTFLVASDIQIAFAADAIVYDEKITEGTQVREQRSRWINSYYENLPRAFGILGKGIRKGRISAVIHGLAGIKPPLLMLVLAALLLSVTGYFIDPRLSYTLVAALTVFSCYFILACYLSPHSAKVARAFLSIPKFLYHQLFAVFHGWKHRDKFVVTENKNTISIDELNDSGNINNHR